MRLEAEATIDIDANRKIWIHIFADGVEADQVEQVAPTLAEQVTAQALAAHEHASQKLSIAPSAAAVLSSVGSGHPSGLSPSERPPRPEDPETMRTFGDPDPDEEDAQ